jgi:hypothetical protein
MRELYLALGKAEDVIFFRRNKQMSLDMNSWVRRAFIAGVGCLPHAEKRPWYKARSLTKRDFLDQIVEKWYRDNPL